MKLRASDGYLPVTIEPDQGDPVTVRLDVYEAHNTYAHLCDTHSDPLERAAAWCGWLAERGLPGLSHGAAFRVAAGIAAEVDEFKKKFDPATSPTSG